MGRRREGDHGVSPEDRGGGRGPQSLGPSAARGESCKAHQSGQPASQRGGGGPEPAWDLDIGQRESLGPQGGGFQQDKPVFWAMGVQEHE